MSSIAQPRLRRLYDAPWLKPAVMLTAVAVAALAWAVFIRVRGQMQNFDGIQYSLLADNIAASAPYVGYYWCPGYPFFLAIVKGTFGEDWEYACATLQFLMLMLACYATTVLPKQRGWFPVVVFVALALSPQLLNQAGKIRNEILCLALLAPAFPLLRKDKIPLDELCLSAVFVGFATHVRNTSIIVAGALALWLFFLDPAAGSWLRRARNAIIFSAVVAVVILPWSVNASIAEGHPVLIASNITQNAPTLNPDRQDRPVPKNTVEHAGYIFRSFWMMWMPLPVPDAKEEVNKWLMNSASMWVITPGFMIACIAAFRDWKNQRVIGMCITVAVIYTGALSLVYPELRYRFPIDPVIYVAGLYGWKVALDAWLRRRAVTQAPAMAS